MCIRCRSSQKKWSAAALYKMTLIVECGLEFEVIDAFPLGCPYVVEVPYGTQENHGSYDVCYMCDATPSMSSDGRSVKFGSGWDSNNHPCEWCRVYGDCPHCDLDMPLCTSCWRVDRDGPWSRDECSPEYRDRSVLRKIFDYITTRKDRDPLGRIPPCLKDWFYRTFMPTFMPKRKRPCRAAPLAPCPETALSALLAP
jgi:hypothetical protein